MTLDELNQVLDAMAADAAGANDDNRLPGLIYLSADTYCLGDITVETTSQIRGMRFRGVRVWVARAFEDKVLSRVEVTDQNVGEFEPLAPAS